MNKENEHTYRGDESMDHNDLKTLFLSIVLFLSIAASYLIIRTDWKRYGLLYGIVGVSGSLICYLFVSVGFYVFPVKFLFPSPFPVLHMLFTVPLFVILGVRYSPYRWAWKIPFYWGLVHFVMFFEAVLSIDQVNIIKYLKWDHWDSYSLWWLFFFLFEYIGGKIVPPESRKPIRSELFRYGQWGFFILHAILISTFFAAGFLMGIKYR